ncbi:bifunctional glycosyltransferase/class I SAM-dependent methyltransferase [uncultured Paludibaculum sp.]|uniref:bifunctional glycosyltransferase/class I SAM-dependent methyltransferase n=1 Tax=uncultured Paludibaculum sp. TaxID=1765020 RepID=UPI002AAB5CCC|nr:bifunctional glycosyltransferase/class I SAM-dependent methyltransferase [uncultured Paludibaculum sp.]
MALRVQQENLTDTPSEVVLEGLRALSLVQEARIVELQYEPKPAFRHLAGDPAMADCRGKRIGILVVTYNAVTTLKGVLQRIPPAVWRNVEEVVILDDASPDATFELALGLKALLDLPKLKILRQQRNVGYGGNQKAGYQYFVEKGFDICVLLHGDGQYAPEVLARMYHPLVTGEADAVFGSRMMSEFGGARKGGMPLYKYVGNRILTNFENLALGLNLTEFHSGFRAYNLHALKQIDMRQMTDDFHFDTEIIIKLHHQNMRIREVPIPTYYGDEICYVDGLKYAANVYRAVRRYQGTVNSSRQAPEFAEYYARYPIKTSRHSSHDYALRLTGHDKDILDIGCGHGYFASKLKENGHRVTGIDFLETPANLDALEDYRQMDLDTGDISTVVGDRRYDYVLLLDVLEHLRDPERLLREATKALRPGGRIIVSVPNVANITVRLQLLAGRFDYAPRGILDSTHLRFYTRRTARRMMEDCGLKSVREKLTVMPVELALGLQPKSRVMRALNACLAVATRLMPGLLGYQIMHVAAADTSTHS